MAKVYTTATATHQVSILVTFTCPKCQAKNALHKYAVIAGEAQARGYNNPMASVGARNDLMATADEKIAGIEKNLKRGNLVLLQEQGKGAGGRKIVCSQCGIRQLPLAGGRRKTLWPKGFWFLIAALGLILVFAVSLASATEGTSEILPAVMFLAGGAVGAGLIVFFKRRSNKAYRDPALMEKAYKSVVNGNVCASSPEFRDFGGIVINSEK